MATFQYPFEFIVDVSDAPEMKAWAEHVAEVCERSYPMSTKNSKRWIQAAGPVTIALKKSYRGVAAAAGPHHRLGHLLQGPSGRRRRDGPRDEPTSCSTIAAGESGWLVEGVSRLRAVFQLRTRQARPDRPEPGPLQRQLPGHGCILELLDRRYDKDIVLKLNRVMREGKYQEDVF